MKKNHSIVAIYPSHTAAEEAIEKLQQSGFDMKKLSIVGREYNTDEHMAGGLKGALGADFYSLGIPKDSILRYKTAVKIGKFVLIAHSSMDDTTHTKTILNSTMPDILEHHQ